MIDVGAVTLVDGPSVKIDDGLGRLVRVSLTNGATFPKGPGVLVEVTLVLIPIVVAVTFWTGTGDLEGSGSVMDVDGCVIDVEVNLLITMFVTALTIGRGILPGGGTLASTALTSKDN